MTDDPISTNQTDDNQTQNSDQGVVFETVPEDVTSEEISATNDNDYYPTDSTSSYDSDDGGGGGKFKFIMIGFAVIFFIAIFVFLLKFFNKSKGTVTKPQNVSLTYWGLWEDKSIFQPLIEEYQKKNPLVKINYVKMDHRDYREKLIQRSRNGAGPDIFRFHNTWLPTITEVVAPIPKSILSDNEYKKIFYPVVEQDMKIDQFYYGMPLEIDGLVLIYNDTLFKRAGVEKPPTTWEEVIDSAAKMTVKDQEGKIFTSGIAIGTASNVEHFSDIFGWMIMQNGGNLKNLNAREAADALEEYRSFAEPPNNLWDDKMSNSLSAFIREEVAMIIAPSWQILTIKQANPDIKLKVTVLPVVPGGTQVSLATYWVEGVSKFSKNQLEGWKFVKFLIEKENLTKLYTEASKTRLFGEPYSRVDLAQTLVQNEYIGPVIQQAKFMKSMPVVSKTFDNGINDGVIKYLQDAINATANGVSYQEALGTAHRGVTQIFTKFSIE